MSAVGTISQSTLAEINGTKGTQSANDAGGADRFLKLLVAQMQNQDPLSPMDNAQVTSQIAQINTVTGIEKLNSSVDGLSGQFMQMQALQGAALVGREVVVPGKDLVFKDGVGHGSFELNAAADAVQVEVLNAAGHVVDKRQLGAQSAGVSSFEWDPGTVAGGATFRITATTGGVKLSPTELVRDTVKAINTSGNQLMLELTNSGSVGYGSVRSFN